MIDHYLEVKVDKGSLRMKIKCHAEPGAPCRAGDECVAQYTLDDLGAEACGDMVFVEALPVKVDASDPEEVWVKLP